MQWVVPQSKSAVTETHILPGVSHFQLEGPEWDRAAAELSVAFGRRVGVWGDTSFPPPIDKAAPPGA